ncbi:MAG TPA: PilC/PilY family type IV pilus protein, partial [Usitatibacter sp.]|nr:PilC/PilY family type IV pilus protein [Usitatibacter sp.]
VLGIGASAHAEDIDLFTAPAGGGTNPNILIILDNSSNWNRNDQAWALGKQGESELRALYTVLGDPTIVNVNLGLMMLSSGAPDGAYIRYHIRPMNATNAGALRELIGTAACAPSNNPVTGKKNCILRDFNSNTGSAGNNTNNSGEMTSAAGTRYSAALFEVFKYFGGYTDPPRANLDQAGTPVNSTHFGPEVYSARDLKFDPGAYAGNNYVSPLTPTNACGKNYVVFIGNGYPSQDLDPAILRGINGDPTVPPPIGNKANFAANWAKYLYTTDVNAIPGRQSVATYTIDVFNAKPDPANQTALLKGMAKFGGGRYYEARDEESIVRALREIFVEIQSVNSVFASASLPINATNRSQNENQVFIGMFRPDRDAKPMWYGNLKEYQIALFDGDARLADLEGKEAVAASTGFIQACAVSDHTVPSGVYWDWSPDSHGLCTSVANSATSDYPDGGIVEKGGAAEVLRRGNDPTASAPFSVNRTIYTCSGSCGSMVAFNSTSVTPLRTGAVDVTEHENIVKFARGEDVNNENAGSLEPNAASVTEPRASIHGDIAHSRPLPVNYGGSRGVVVYYGSNDGTFKAMEGNTGKELWSFIAPEHHGKLKRLYRNTPPITYPGIVNPGAVRKDYFFDGSSGLLQNGDNSEVWIFPTMRRGGRMIYAFRVTETAPELKWARGCPNAGDDVGCSAGFTGIGQTWSGANVAYVKGYENGDKPVIVMGGGYDNCLDSDAAVSTCTAAAKGNKVYIIDAYDGSIIRAFDTDRPVAADVTLIDRDFDGKVDMAYAADALGSVYRVNFTDSTTVAALAPGAWTMAKVAATTSGNRKFLFGPAALAIGEKVYLALGTGDRERPLATNYPYTAPVQNRFYSFIDTFDNTVVDLDGASMDNFTSGTDCNSVLGTGKRGWFMNLEGGRGEQTVTSAVIFGGTVFFSTNRPTPVVVPGSCAANLGEARGYAINLLNASGVIGTGKLCGGARSGTFTGGGIPPSPVVGIVPIVQPDGTSKPTSVLIGGINLEGTASSPIAAQEPKIPIRQIRSRIYWYPHGDR